MRRRILNLCGWRRADDGFGWRTGMKVHTGTQAITPDTHWAQVPHVGTPLVPELATLVLCIRRAGGTRLWAGSRVLPAIHSAAPLPWLWPKGRRGGDAQTCPHPPHRAGILLRAQLPAPASKGLRWGRPSWGLGSGMEESPGRPGATLAATALCLGSPGRTHTPGWPGLHPWLF